MCIYELYRENWIKAWFCIVSHSHTFFSWSPYIFSFFYRQFKPRQSIVVIDFSLIDATAASDPTLPVSHNFTNEDINTNGDIVKDKFGKEKTSEDRVQNLHDSKAVSATNNNRSTDKEVALRKLTDLHSQQNTENPKQESSCQGQNRKDYLEWQEYFMSIAFLSAQRSKDPRTQVVTSKHR